MFCASHQAITDASRDDFPEPTVPTVAASSPFFTSKFKFLTVSPSCQLNDPF
ncbi:hypothetical protein HanXRQr2_Chr09g0380731 [Helianthus annuus]|uniref:Uncharacterized protein n=1 Tax=Helianthus annuus TaxID=4232 RepID=A0A9K3I4D4_HELAN|nr:hypothetical protein HanXRQr2_Chr09g0380731 [Helianthus annuus]